jgi:hypothetical protein
MAGDSAMKQHITRKAKSIWLIMVWNIKIYWYMLQGMICDATWNDWVCERSICYARCDGVHKVSARMDKREETTNA